MKLVKLFEPGYIQGVELKNRLAMPATCTQQAEEGYVSQAILDFYEARAKGGIGLLIVGYVNVDPEPCIGDPGDSVEVYRKKWVDGPVLNLYDDRFMPGLQKLVDLIHGYDVKVGAHFNSISTQFGGSEGLRRDALFRKGPFQRLNTAGRLREIIEHTASAAGRAKAIGFDLMEFGASGEALLGQTLSHHPRRNPQIKGYCEGREGKLRFALEMIKETREVIGPECPLGIRILAHEYMEGGYGLEESKIYSQRFEEAGLDFINVAVAPHSATVPQLPLIVPGGAFRYLNKGIKEVVNIPVFASVRINDVRLGERILRNEEADYINMCRPIMADPELPKKAQEGRFEDIVPCIGCIECLGVAYEGGVCCTINPECGREREMKITPAEKKKRVVVIGSGPAGMEVARVAKLRGHDVVLYEKEQELGGTFRLASVAPGKQEMALMVDYLSRQMRKLGVEVKCRVEVTPATIDDENVDVLIIATGGVTRVPDIPGLENSSKVISYKDVLMENEVVGQKVVIIGEGGIGCETALFIAKKSAIDNDSALYLASWGAVSPEQAVAMATKSSKEITMTRRGKVVGEGITPYLRWNTVASLKRFGIEMLIECEYKEINEKGLVVTRDGEEILLEADTIVLAAGWDPNDALMEELKDKAPEVYAVGNVKEVRRIFFIMQEASRLARKI